MSMWRLYRQALSGKYTPSGRAEDADCVLGFSFGGIADGNAWRPGDSNEDLARFARDHFAGLPKILQSEIAESYLALCPGSAVLQISRHRRPGLYLDTREVAEQALDLMRQHDWRTAAVLAQGYHVPRAAAVCERLGISAVVPPGLEQIRFCLRSAQKWTRGPGAWIRRELLAILFYRWKGWV
jgi:hypothetical protein